MDGHWIDVMVGLLLGVIIGFALGGIACESHWQRQAIQHGAAEYDRESGAFKWKENK